VSTKDVLGVPATAVAGWVLMGCCKTGAGTVFDLLGKDGTTGFKSALETGAKGENAGKAEDDTAGEMSVLFDIKLEVTEGNVGCSIVEMLKGKVEVGREDRLKRELLVFGAKGEGYSVRLETCKPGPPGAIEEPEYGNCCIGGGTDRPGGGRSKGCCGNPFGVP
jgi:hypothetical protein